MRRLLQFAINNPILAAILYSIVMYIILGIIDYVRNGPSKSSTSSSSDDGDSSVFIDSDSDYDDD